MPEERIKVNKIRQLGADERPEPAPSGGAPGAPAPVLTPERAREVLQAEFDRVLEMKGKLAAENAVGGREKGRDSTRGEEKLRGLVASLEGMSRFALKLGLLAPADSRAMFADAMKRGLYDGWVR
jgi:hypothetical protein